MLLRTLFFTVMLALLAPAALLAAPTKASVTSVSGTVEVAGPGSADFAPLKAGTKVEVGSTVRTGADGTAILVPVPGCAIRVANSTTLVISQAELDQAGKQVTSRKATVELKDGTVSTLINSKLMQPADFRVQTAQGVAAARGTFFAVTAKGGKTYVAVKHGKVGVARAKNP
ncbi:MAG: FecR domain-containing protein [Candidatus Methylacidiphilales bacterium]|nr:FecR domain-containing protein [Candidatus Methylacidiphilales bacterium]